MRWIGERGGKAARPAYLQQLAMKSTGKRAAKTGRLVSQATAASVFGDAGTNGQHAFFQLLDHWTDIIPIDFIALEQEHEGPAEHRGVLLANAIAQAEALMIGLENAREPHRHFPGNRPSSFILMERLSPDALGALIALYEHKTFVGGVLWGIDSFDQRGVELGKVLARAMLRQLDGGGGPGRTPSTAALIARLRR